MESERAQSPGALESLRWTGRWQIPRWLCFLQERPCVGNWQSAVSVRVVSLIGYLRPVAAGRDGSCCPFSICLSVVVFLGLLVLAPPRAERQGAWTARSHVVVVGASRFCQCGHLSCGRSWR